jgi:hypothetical protein
MGIYDTFYQPNAKRLKALDETIQVLQKQAEEKKQEEERFRKWQSELKNTSSSVSQVKSGESPKVVASTIASKIVEVAKGLSRNPALGEPLPSPHNQRQFINFKPLEEGAMDLSEGEQDKSGPVKVQQFRYELTISGTYAALADFINDLVISKYAIDIDKISLKPGDGKELVPVAPDQARPSPGPEGRPSAEGTPQDQTPVTMVMEFSLYLYDAEHQ